MRKVKHLIQVGLEFELKKANIAVCSAPFASVCFSKSESVRLICLPAAENGSRSKVNTRCRMRVYKYMCMAQMLLKTHKRSLFLFIQFVLTEWNEVRGRVKRDISIRKCISLSKWNRRCSTRERMQSTSSMPQQNAPHIFQFTCRTASHRIDHHQRHQSNEKWRI